MRSVREKAVDDVRRNRELAADGLTVFPITKEDLREKGGLDRVMRQVVESIERTSSLDMVRTQARHRSRRPGSDGDEGQRDRKSVV